MISFLWNFCLHITICWLNKRKGNLFIYWLTLIHEINPTVNCNHKLTNLPRNEKDENFWLKSSQLNYKFALFNDYFVITVSLFFCMPYFRLKTDLNFLVFWFFAILNYLVFIYYVINLTRTAANLNFILVTILRYFQMKYKFINKQVKTLKDHQKKIDNEKLSKLIFDWMNFALQMIKTNTYWKFISGINFLFLFMIAVVMTFLLIKVDFFFGFMLSSFMAISLTLNFFVAFYFNNQILNEMNNINHHLQKISLFPETNLANRKKINYCTFYMIENRVGFSCFCLFYFNLYATLKVSVKFSNLNS